MINVVMATCDRLPLLQQSLSSLILGASVPLSITLVDDSHDPSTVEWLRCFGISCSYSHCIRNVSPGCVGAAKNHGVSVAFRYRSDYLYICDSDIYHREGWDKVLIDTYSYYGQTCPIVGGWNHPYLKPNTQVGVMRRLDQDYALQSYDAIAGVSWLLSWDAWDKYGPFAANAVGPRQSEDWEFCQRVRADGKQVGAVSPWPVLHTGLTDSQGKRAPGAEIYAKEIPWGVLAE